MKRICILFSLMLVFINGCSSMSDEQQKQVKVGIIDACYTVTEYNPCDKEQRIKKYLDKKQEQDLIEEEQRFILQKCLNRTEKSFRWSEQKK